MEANPTRTLQTPDGVTLEWAAVNSVELTVTAKGEVRISTIKVYDADENAALDRAFAVYTASLKRLAALQPTTGEKGA